MAPTAAPKHLSVAVDTNVLMDLARGEERVIDAVALIRRRIAHAQIWVLPTVIQELTHIADFGDTQADRRAALGALQSLAGKWRFRPVNLIPAGHAITESVANKIREAGLLPAVEVNDSLFIAEASLAGCPMIVSSDRHVCEIDQVRLNALLAACAVSAVAIASPRQLIRQFTPKRSR